MHSENPKTKRLLSHVELLSRPHSVLVGRPSATMGAHLSINNSNTDDVTEIRDQYRDFSLKEIMDQYGIFLEDAESCAMLDEEEFEEIFGCLFGDIDEHFEFWKEENDLVDELVYEVRVLRGPPVFRV
jgi:hypothetical protein